jgi:hypothetical protein
MRNRVNDVEEASHEMSVIVLLILSASAIAMPTLGPSSLSRRLRNEGVTKKEWSECCNRRGNKNANFKVVVAHAKQRQRRNRRASLDELDGLVDLERLGDRDATLGAELVVPQATKRGGNKIGMIGMLLSSHSYAVTKNANFEVEETHPK